MDEKMLSLGGGAAYPIAQGIDHPAGGRAGQIGWRGAVYGDDPYFPGSRAHAQVSFMEIPCHLGGPWAAIPSTVDRVENDLRTPAC